MWDETAEVQRRVVLSVGVFGVISGISGCLRLTNEADGGEATAATPADATDRTQSASRTQRTEQSGTTASGTATASPSGTVSLNDQTTDGTYVTVAAVETSVEAIIQLYDAGEFLANPGIRFEPGERREGFDVGIDPPVTESGGIEARLFWCEESGPSTCNGPEIARDRAMLTVE